MKKFEELLIVQEIVSEIAAAKKTVSSALTSVKDSLLEEVDTKWNAYKNTTKEYTEEKTKYESLDAGEEKDKKRSELDEQINKRFKTLEELKKSISILDGITLAFFDINLPVEEPIINAAWDKCFIDRKKLQGQPIPISNEEELNEELEYCSEQHKAFKIAETAFDKAWEAYNKKFPNVPLSAVPEQKEIFDAQLGVKDKGQKAMGIIGNLNRRVREILFFADSDMLAETTVYPREPRLLVDIQMDNKMFTTKFMNAIRSGKAAAVTVPIEKVKHRQDLRAYLQEDDMKIDGLLPEDELILGYINSVHEHDLTVDCYKLLKEAKDYQKIATATGIANNIENMREQLYRLRNDMQSWMQRYKDETKAGTIKGDDVQKLKKLADDIKIILPRIQQNLVAVGTYAVLHDNFSDLVIEFNNISAQLTMAESLYEKVMALGKVRSKGDNEEEYKTKGLELVDSKDKLKKSINKFAEKANDWCTRHNSDAFGLKLKREELQDKTRDLMLRANDVDIRGLAVDKFEELKDAIPTTYDIDKDKLLKKIHSKLETLKGLEKGSDYDKRYTKLGDLNNLIQEWDFKYRHYPQGLIKNAKVQVDEAGNYLEHQFEAVNALLSIKQLGDEMNKDLWNYSEMVMDFNDSAGDYKGDFPSLLNGSTRLLEFINVWLAEYDKAKENIEALGQSLSEKIETKKKRVDKLKSIIEDNNLAIITGMVDMDKVHTAETNLAKNTKVVNSEKSTIDGLHKSLDEMRDKLKKLKKATPPDNKAIEALTKDIKKENIQLANAVKLVDDLEKENKSLEKTIEVERANIENAKPDASALYLRLTDLYKSKDDFQFTPDLNIIEYSERWQGISHLLGLIADWRQMVFDPNAPNLAPYKKAVDGIEADLLKQRDQFKANKSFEDKLFKRIEIAWKIVEKENGDKDNPSIDSEKSLLNLHYCLKLINLWYKENPVVIESEKETRKKLKNWKRIIEAEIKPDNFRFADVKEKQRANEKLKELEDLIASIRSDIDSRVKSVLGNKTFNVNNPEGESAIVDWSQNFAQVVNAIDYRKSSKVEKLMMEEKYAEANALVVELFNELTDAYREGQVELTLAVRESEALVFAGLGDGDYDYESSGQFTPEQIDLMNKTMANAVARANAIMEAGASIAEIQQAVAHLPTAMLPDKFIEQLAAFEITEKAMMEEMQRAGEEEAARAMGLSDILLDTKAYEELSEITSALSEIMDATTFQKWVEEDGEYGDFVSGTSDKQSDGHDTAATVITFIDNMVGMMGDFAKLKEELGDTKEFRKAVGEFIFNGTIDFESSDTDIHHAETTDANVVKISQRKRILILTGMKFVANISSQIENLTESKELEAATKSIALFFGTLVQLLEAGSSPKVIAKTTQQLWNDRIDAVTTIAQGLLSTGKTIAETVAIFAQLPSGLMPALGIAVGAVNLAVNIKGIAQKMIERHHTKSLLKEAQMYDRAYIGPLKQEIASLNRRIAKQSVEAAVNAMEIAAGITTLAGHPEAGAAIALAAGILKLGNKIVFEGINEAMLKDARDTLKKARAGDREAKIKIMEKSPVYAKMFIAIGCTNEPPDAIALEFVRQRGITERDIKNAGTSKYIIRRFIRQKMLEHAEEADNHDGKLGIFKGLAAKWKAWRAKVNKKEGFWDGKNQNYQTLLEIYPGAKLSKLVNETVKGYKSDIQEVLDFWGVDNYTQLPFFDDVKMIFKLLKDQESTVMLELGKKGLELEKEVKLDTSDTEEDHGPIILELEQSINDLETQKDELEILLATLKLLETSEFKFAA